MQIREIQVVDVKRTTRTVDVGRVTVFVGDNGAGKTAFLEAVQLLVAGAVSEGKRLADIAKLGGPSGLSARLDLDDGWACSRKLTKHHTNGTLSMTYSVTGADKATAKVCLPLIGQKLGDFAPMFNVPKIANSSPEVLRNLLLSLVGPSLDKATPEGMADDIMVEFCRIGLGDGVVDAMPEGYDLLNKLDRDVRVSLLALVAGLKPQLTPDDAMAALANVLESVRRDVLGYDKLAKSKATSIEQHSARIDELTVVAESADALKTELAERRDDQNETERKIGAANTRRERISELLADIGRAALTITGLQADLEAKTAPTVEETTAAVAKLLQQAVELEAIAEPTIAAETGTRFQETEKAKDAALSTYNGANISANRAIDNLRAAEARLSSIKASPWTRCRELSGKLHPVITTALSENATALDCWTTLTDILVVQSAPEKLEEAEKDVADAKRVVELADDQLGIVKAAQEESIQAFAIAKQASDDAIQAGAADIVAHRDRQEKARKLRLDATAVKTADDFNRRAIQTTKDRILETTNAKAANETQLKELQAAEEAEPFNAITRQAEELVDEIEVLEGKLESKTDWASLDKQLKLMVADAEKAIIDHKVAKQALKAIKKIRERHMEQLVEPLTSGIGWFLRAAGLDHPVFCELQNANGVDIFDLGWEYGEGDKMRRVVFTSFGSGERMLFTAAIAYALVKLANPPLQLLMLDELGPLDKTNLARMLRAMVAVGDAGMQVLASTYAPVQATDNINVIECEATELVAAE